MGRGRKIFLLIGGFMFLSLGVCLPMAAAQPFSMGKVELQGKTVVKGSNGLVFQAPKETEAPLMRGASIETGKNGKALFDWTSKGSMVLDNNSEASVTEEGFELTRGTLTLRLNPGQEMKVKALGKVYIVKAPAGKVGVATISVANNAVKTAGAVFLGGGGAATASAAAYVGPALIAGGAAAGIAGVAGSASTNGGPGVASPSNP